MTTSITLIPARRRIRSSHTTFIYDGGISMSGIFSAITRSIATISGVQSAEVLRDRIALIQDQLSLAEKAYEEAQATIANQTKRIKELESELSGYRAAQEYTEHRGALFKRKPNGRYIDAVYCPRCKTSAGSLDDQMPFHCSPCRWTSSFNSGELGTALAELAREN